MLSGQRAAPLMCRATNLHIGTAGWNVPKEHAAAFPIEGSHLERYAQVFDAVEINSSFHRPYRVTTYQRWAASVPEAFLFAVKVPKAVTHESRLSGTAERLDRFLGEVSGLGDRLGPLLVQLPPSLSFEAGVADRFLRGLRDQVGGHIACEPRHKSWFTSGVDALLNELRIGRVAADPAPVPDAGVPGGWRGLTYLRLHGSPQVYVSSYGEQDISAIVARLASHAAHSSTCWCIFDNTAAFAATGNALTAKRSLANRTTEH